MLVLLGLEVFRMAAGSLPAGAAFHSGQVQWANGFLRGRDLGLGDALLVDLPWDVVGSFYEPAALRGAAARKYRVVQYKHGSAVGKPTASSVLDLSNAWIGGDLDPVTAEDYATGVEQLEEEPDAGAMAAEGSDMIAQLQQRILDLEAAAAAQPMDTCQSLSQIDLWMKSSDSAVVTSLSQINLWMRRSDSTVMPVEMFLPRRSMRIGVMEV